MVMSNTEKQAAWRKHRQADGLVHFQAWVTIEQAAVIRALLAGTVTSNQPAKVTYNHSPPATVTRNRKRRKLDPAAEKNGYLHSGVGS